jgi:hypothetical protein
MQSLQYFWALQRSAMAHLSARGFQLVFHTFQKAFDDLPASPCPRSASKEALQNYQMLVTVTTALLAQFFTLAPRSEAELASSTLLGFFRTLSLCHKPGILPGSGSDACTACDDPMQMTHDGCVAMQQLVAYLKRETPSTLTWLQV